VPNAERTRADAERTRADAEQTRADAGQGPEPPPPEVAVGAVVVDDGRLLVVRRANPPSATLWSLPGGRVRRGEDLRSAVVREVREETGLAVEVTGLCGFAERIGEGHHYVILDFWARVRGGRQRAGDDASDVDWFSADRLDAEGGGLVPGLAGWLAEHGVRGLLR
jgi:8-oxo-dGTP diphosphatase